MESDYHWLVAVALVTSSIIAVTANAFLLLIFARRRSLRTIPNRFVINLLVTNLLSSILLIPLLVVDQGFLPTELNQLRHQVAGTNETDQSFEEDVLIKEEIFNPATNQTVAVVRTSEQFVETSSTTFGNNFTAPDTDHLCYFAQASTSFVCTASIFSILLIGINQYFGVIHSLRYHFYVSKPRATVFILSSWLAALSCAALSTVTHSDGGLWHFCATGTASSEASAGAKALNTAFAFSYFFVVILAPFLAICIIYLCIYTAAHQNSERMRKSTSACSTTPLDAYQTEEDVQEEEEAEEAETRRLSSDRRSGLPKVHSAPNFSSLENSRRSGSTIIVNPETVKVKRTSSDRNNFIVNLKHKISNASVFRYREETRAAKISVLVIFMVLICYVPYGLTLVLSSSCIGISPGKIFNYLSLVLLVFSNVISPFLFGYRNKRVKREIGRLLGLVPASSTSSSKLPSGCDVPRKPSGTITKNRSYEEGINVPAAANAEPLLVVPEVVVTCKVENEKKSILKRVGSGWSSYKKCNFITVPDSCLGDARGSFSSASTQVSNDEF